MTAHAKLSASASHRWMACPGSIKAEEGFADIRSVFAQEGSCAHYIGEQVLLHGGHASDWLGVKVDGFEEIEVTAAMCDHVQTYVDYVRALPGLLMVEQRLDFSHIVPEGFGTSDTVILDGDALTIVDLKFGKGVRVDARDNSQLMLYALGAVEQYSYAGDFQTITMVIVQPRLDHISEWTITREDLDKFGVYAAKAAQMALSDNAPRIPTEKGCVFCKAKATCPALKAHTDSVLMADFDNEDKLPEMTSLTHEQMSRMLANKGLIVKFLEAIEHYAVTRIEQGETFPGFKMVAGRSNRKISDEEFAIRMLKQNGYTDEQIMKPATLKTITELEKVTGKKEFNLVLGDVIVKPEGAPTLVSSEDPRPELKLGVTAEDFS
jgi:hypothetical protein